MSSPSSINYKRFIIVGQNDDMNIFLLPSGWLHLDTSKPFATGLGIENYKIVDHNVNRKLISINLKDILQTKQLKKLRFILKERIIIDKPIVATWYPHTTTICPSSLAKYFHSLGAEVIQKLPEMEIIRTKPPNQQIPKIAINHKSLNNNQTMELKEYENMLGGAFLRLPE